jgi:hypothetical protein
LISKYDERLKQKNDYILQLIDINKDLSQKMDKTPIGWETIKDGYRNDISNNDKKINETKAEISNIESELKIETSKLENKLNSNYSSIDSENMQNIILFIIIAVVSELLIFFGIYFREWYEYKLMILGEQKYEKFYLKRDRYRALITFVYNSGKAIVGDKVISGAELKELVKEKTTLPNSNKLVDEFLKDMDNMGVFNIVGKRRHIGVIYDDAIDVIENFDDTYRILENMK